MNGLQIILPIAVTDTALPILYADRVISNGTLLLMDLARSPAPNLNTGAVIPNVAADTAAVLLGTAVAANISPYIARGTGFTGTAGKVEVTPKGGLHTLVSQVNHTDFNNMYFGVYLPATMRDYLYNNRAHSFFVSVWRRNTRVAATGADLAKLAITFLTSANYLAFERAHPTTDTEVRPNGANRTGHRDAAANTLGNYIKNVAFTGVTGDPSTNATSAKSQAGNGIIICGGGVNAYTSGTVLNKCPSFVTYRVLIEDLSVSGRTYEQCDAIDIAQYNEAFGVGGKFYGDTLPTDPSTFA